MTEEELSVEQYYFDVYSYTLKYRDLPALDVGNKKKPTFIPLEVNISVSVRVRGVMSVLMALGSCHVLDCIGELVCGCVCVEWSW